MSLADNRWFRRVRAHLDAMLEYGKGPDSPLFAGVVDLGRRRAQVAWAPPPPGIRVSDYNWCGNNLMHDVPLLETMLALTRLTGDARYERAVDAMFAYYGKHCPEPTNGLFPWGEHAQWSFCDREILPCSFMEGLRAFRAEGHVIHDHLRFAPAWFWDRMWAHHPQAVVKFAKGLDGHVVDAKTFEHNRHAALRGKWWRDPHKPDFDQGHDFARHSGFYVFDCLYAFKRSGDRGLLEWARRKLDWHLGNRFPNGLVRGCVRSPGYEKVGQHDALALCVADAADLLGRETPEGRAFGADADELFDARRRTCKGRATELPDCPGDPRLWLNGYTRRHLLPESRIAQGNILRDVHARTGIPWYAEQLVALGRWLAQHLPDPPPDVMLLPRAFQQHLEMLLWAHLESGERPLLEAAERVAGRAEERLWAGEMFLGTSNQRFYGSGTNYEFFSDPWATDASSPGFYHGITGTPLLVRTLLQLALVQEGQPDFLGPDPHRRN
jgi:hypothetical protein